jgi:two-component system, OmpR family, alkaline phosphatase synthesis response regulator PhoP
MSAGAQRPTSGGPKTILVLEDDGTMQRFIEQTLESEGFRVELAKDGLEGLVKIDRIKPDLIIADIMMPRLDGLTFARAVKAHEQTKAIPIIFLTGRGDSRSMIEGINVGARYYLTKPFDPDDLVAKIKKALGLG